MSGGQFPQRPTGSHRWGLTFPEVVVAAAVAGILGLVLMTSLSVGHSVFVFSETSVQLQEQARWVLAQMVTDLRQAGGHLTVTPNACTFQAPLGYNLGAPCEPYALCWGAEDPRGVGQPGWFIRYRMRDGQLVRELLDADGSVQPSARVFGAHIREVIFRCEKARATLIRVFLRFEPASPSHGRSALTRPMLVRAAARPRNPIQILHVAQDDGES